jgi:hypothetical protein
MKRVIPAGGLAAAFVASAVATVELYNAQGETEKCMIVDKKPTDASMTS